MKRRSFSLIVLLLIFIASACDSKKKILLELKKVDSLVLRPDTTDLFGSFYEDFRINKNGSKLAFYDRVKEKVFVFDHQGEFIKSYGENNKGPKGIISVDGYDFNSSDEVVILDLRQGLLKVFEPSGEIVKSSIVFEDESYFLSGFGFYMHNDTIYLPILEGKYGNQPDSSALVGKMDLDGKFSDVFGNIDPFLNDDNQYVLDNVFDITSNGIIHTNLTSSFRIQSYDINKGNYIGIFGVRFPSFSLPRQEVSLELSIPEINERMTGSSVTNSIHSTEEYFIQHVQVLTKEWFENVNYEDKDNFLVIYDMQTKEFLGEIHTDHTLGAVHKNKLYMIEDFNPDNYTIGIYELVESE